MSLFQRLRHPDSQHALTLGGESLTYAELAAAARGHARTLEKRGIQSGARVAVWAQPSLQTAIALVGNATLGVASVPLNPKLGSRELEHILEDSGASLVLAADAAAARERHPATEAISYRSDPGAVETIAGEEIALLLYTSGTTGAPKGAEISARAIGANLDALAKAWRWTAEDTVVHALPLFHVHGLVLGLYGSLRAGGALHHLPKFEPGALAAGLREASSSVLFSVPTIIHRLAEVGEAGDRDVVAALKSARLLISGSAGLATREHRRIEALAGRGVLERYGLTETLINCAVPASAGPQPGYVGPPLDGVELRLVNDARQTIESSDDETLAEVAVRSRATFSGYLGRPEATAKMRDEEGWHYTGDLATRRADGMIRIVGRKSIDLIKTGGYKVGAGEIEACIRELPGIREVAAVGEPDPDLGQRIIAFIVRSGDDTPSPEAIIDEVAQQLTPHKRPREVRFVEALPRNAMGKVQKRKLLDP